MAARSQSRGGVRGCGTTDGAGAQRVVTILECHRPRCPTRNGRCECDRLPVGGACRRCG